VAATASPSAALRTVASLGEVGRGAGVEVIVAARFARPPGLSDGVTWLDAGPDVGVARLRRLGLERARGGIVVFTEDSCAPVAGWLDAWRAAFDRPDILAASGPVVPAMGDLAVDWAVVFCEYAPFFPGARPARLAGNNCAGRRAGVGWGSGTELHESDVGQRAAVLADLAVCRHVRRYAVADAIGDRLRFGHEYGLRRASTLTTPGRLAALVVGPLVMLVQSARLTATVVGGGRYLGAFADAAPVTFGLLAAWSVGEWLGWLHALAMSLSASRRPRGTAGRTPAPRAGPGPSRRSRYSRVPPAA
jgi:hypothetical protein